MPHRPRAALIILSLAGLASPLVQGAPAPDSILQARPALRFDPDRRCTDVRAAGPDDETVVVVLFQVGSTGVPAQAAVKSSSGAADLDAAAVNCVLKLRFQPATRMGDGVAIESWQQMSWRRARVPNSATVPAAAVATGAAIAPPAPAAVASAAASAVTGSGAADVRVCVDASGRPTGEPTLAHSSGDAAFDEAALQLARSGSYHGSSSAQSHCLQLSLRALP